jgi:hypothetical protein
MGTKAALQVLTTKPNPEGKFICVIDWFFNCLDQDHVLCSRSTGERVAIELPEVDGNLTLTSQANLRVLTTKPNPEGVKVWWSRPVFQLPRPEPCALLE